MLVIDDNEGINRIKDIKIESVSLFNFFFIFSWKMDDAKKEKFSSFIEITILDLWFFFFK